MTNRFEDMSWWLTQQYAVEYSNTFGSHDVSGLLLWETKQYKREYFKAQGQLDNSIIGELDAANAVNRQVTGNSEAKFWAGLVGRFNYSYAGKYLAEVSFRYDGSYKFAKEKRWNMFPAFSVGWRLSEENFVKDNTDIFDNIKIRASYGIIGDEVDASPGNFYEGYTYPGNDFVFGAGNSTGVSPLYRKDNTFYAAKVMDTKMVPDSVYVRHILLQGDDEALADSLMTVLKSGKNSFSNVAALYSADQNMNVPERGDIGWMTQTFMIPGMESVLTAKKGTLYTIDTQYGKHIVEVTKTTDPIRKKQVAIFEKEIIPSKATYNEFYSKANVLATKAAGKYENFKAAVQEEGLYAHPVNRMLESSSRLGTIDNTKEVTRWAFEAKKGQASNIITVNNDYFFVVAVKDVHKEGYATLQEMAGTIRSILYNQKLAEKKTQEVAEKIKDLGSMQAIADALNTTVSTSDNVTFASLTSQGLDPKFIGAVSVAEPGVINGPLTGSIGVYVYKVTAHDTGSFFTEDDARTRNEQMSQYSTQMLMPVMMKDGDVKDNRARFY